MELLNKAQLIAVNTLISKLKFTSEQKEGIISGFTTGRTISTKELSKIEATELISHLKSLDPDEKKAENMRRKIISMAHELNWKLPGSSKIDMRLIDDWCKKFGYGKKKLNHYTFLQLPKLVTQFEQGPYSHYLKSK